MGKEVNQVAKKDLPLQNILRGGRNVYMFLELVYNADAGANLDVVIINIVQHKMFNLL